MGSGFDFAGILPLILIFVVMYFLIIRPQNKKAKKHREMLSHIVKGDEIVTNGGLIGKVQRAEDAELVVEIAKGVEVRISRNMIASKRSTEERALTQKAEKKEAHTEAAVVKKKPAAKISSKAKKS